MEPNFAADFIKFGGSDTTRIYALRFQAFEQSFATIKKILTVLTTKIHDEDHTLSTGDNCGESGTISSRKFARIEPSAMSLLKTNRFRLS